MSQLHILATLFSLAVTGMAVLVYRIVIAVEHEDRTYADKPPKILRWMWAPISLVNFYLGRFLTVEYRERTIRRLRKVELDYAVSPQQWFSSKIVFAIMGGILFLLLGLWLGSHSPLFPLVGFGFGFCYLEIWMRDQVKRTEIELLKHLPTFLDMLTLAIESGCNLTVGINIAVEKTPDSSLRRAFARALREIRSGRSRIDALRMLEDRLDNAAVTSMTSALVQAEKTGASLGTVLRGQSTQRTNERFSRAEKLAMEAPVKMLGPLILCIFPCTFVVIGFPIGMKMMNAFQ